MTDEPNEFEDIEMSEEARVRRPEFNCRETETRHAVNRVIQLLNRPGDHQIVFQYAGKAQVIVRDRSSVLRSTVGNKHITRSMPRVANKGLLAGPIEMVSQWGIFDGRSGQWAARQVPPWVMTTIVETYGEGLLPLAGIADFPVMISRDKLLSGRIGYDPQSHLYVDCEPVEMDTNKFDDPREAYRWLMDNWLCDFPFKTPADAARAITVCLTIMNRRTRISGGAPIPFITAPEVNTGKTLLACVLVEVVTGGTLPVAGWDLESDQERRKNMLAISLENAAAVLFDNIPNGWEIRDATLDKYITRDEYKDRLLGKNETATAPTTTYPLFTGNNIGPGSEDLISRSFDIRLERPIGRRKFKHTDLAGWTQANRIKILQALYCIARTDGRKLGKWTPESRFPSWAKIVAAPVQYAAQDDTLFNVWSDLDAPRGNEDLELLLNDMANRPSVNDVGYTAKQMGEMFNDQILELLGPTGSQYNGKIPFKKIQGALKRYRDNPAGKNRLRIEKAWHPSRNDVKLFVFKAEPL